MNSWANKFNNKWFVRVDSKGIPVYGSLIDRPTKPKQGRWIEVTSCIPNNICCDGFNPLNPGDCDTQPENTFSVTLTSTNYTATGQNTFTISNDSGLLLNLISYNKADSVTNIPSHPNNINELVKYLNTTYPAYGTFSHVGDNISLESPLKNITLTASYQPFVASNDLNESGLATATGISVIVPGYTDPNGAIFPTPGSDWATTMNAFVDWCRDNLKFSQWGMTFGNNPPVTDTATLRMANSHLEGSPTVTINWVV